jgi:hypothetical protein
MVLQISHRLTHRILRQQFRRLFREPLLEARQQRPRMLLPLGRHPRLLLRPR